MPEENDNIIPFREDMTYDLARDTLRIERRHLHCVQVVLQSDSPGERERPQAKSAFIGGAVIELDLRPEGNKAILRTAQGEKRISIASSAPEPNRTLIGKKRNVIEIGEILRNQLAGKEALRTFLRSPPQERDSLIVSYLDSIVHRLAQEAHLLPPEASVTEEMKMLQQREDFVYGKDYTGLYDPVIYAPQKEEERDVEAHEAKEMRPSAREQRRNNMQSEWFVSSNAIDPAAGLMIYQAQRKKDADVADYSGNREEAGAWFKDKEKAQEIVDKLNAAEKERGEALTAQEARAIADKLNAEEHHKKAQEEEKPMAEQEEKQPEKETQAKKPQEKKTTKELVSEASKAFSERMQEAHASGNAVWQKPYEERQNIHAPVLIYQGRDGEHKSFYPPVANMLPAVQHQLDIGSQDNRWIPAKEAGANPDITIRKDAKAVTFVLFTKDKQPYTKKFFNMADVSGKGVPALAPTPELRRDAYLHDMIDYLARRTERGTFKGDNYFLMVMDAKEAANKSYQAKKEVYDFQNLDYGTYMKARLEANRRLDAILGADVQEVVPAKDYEKTFIQLLAKEIREPSKETNYVIRAARKALNELKWQQSHVKAAMKALVPQAAFDSLARSGKMPSQTLFIIAVKGVEQNKAQEAAR